MIAGGAPRPAVALDDLIEFLRARLDEPAAAWWHDGDCTGVPGTLRQLLRAAGVPGPRRRGQAAPDHPVRGSRRPGPPPRAGSVVGWRHDGAVGGSLRRRRLAPARGLPARVESAGAPIPDADGAGPARDGVGPAGTASGA
jgi:hypothetical protein